MQPISSGYGNWFAGCWETTKPGILTPRKRLFSIECCYTLPTTWTICVCNIHREQSLAVINLTGSQHWILKEKLFEALPSLIFQRKMSHKNVCILQLLSIFHILGTINRSDINVYLSALFYARDEVLLLLFLDLIRPLESAPTIILVESPGSALGVCFALGFAPAVVSCLSLLLL